MQMKSRLIKQDYGVLKITACLGHEQHVERKEPLKTLRPFFKRNERGRIRILHEHDQLLSVCLKSYFILLLRPTVCNLIR